MPNQQKKNKKTKKKEPFWFIYLRVLLADNVTGLKITQWLKIYPPLNVIAVKIEALILKARRLQSLTDALSSHQVQY